jgi:hypothetical protein
MYSDEVQDLLQVSWVGVLAQLLFDCIKWSLTCLMHSVVGGTGGMQLDGMDRDAGLHIGSWCLKMFVIFASDWSQLPADRSSACT